MASTSIFSFKKQVGYGLDISCEEAVSIPLNQPLKWLCARLVLTHGIPKYVETDFTNALGAFIEDEEKKYYDSRIGQMYEDLLPNDAIVDTISKFFQTVLDERSETCIRNGKFTDEDIFGQAYAKIVQSPAAMDLIQLEHSFAVAVETEVIERNRALNEFQQRIVIETQQLIDRGSGEASDLDDAVSDMQSRFHIEYEVERTKWDSRISDLKELQRRDYRSFVTSIEEQMLCSAAKSNPLRHTSNTRSVNPPAVHSKASSVSKRFEPENENNAIDKQQVRSESFNVQLGRQLRISYNLKLIQADPMDLMTTLGTTTLSQSSERSATSETSVSLAERLGNALTIYSNDLTGLIILVDRHMFQSKDQIRLAEVCERSTDFHFPELDRQLAEIRDTIDHFAANNSATTTNTGDDGSSQKSIPDDLPEPGDVYITRHTNLSSAIGGVAGGGGGVGVVFHVIMGEKKDEDRLRCLSPLYSALSAILRVCFQYDITTLAMPLLLTRRLAEQTTANWCYSRAEAVFKAVKGSMMELATLRGQVLRTLLFLVPPQLPPSVSFESFSHLLASSFQQPNPLIASIVS